jgi:5-carboxymethyl-2-hydroxymuconate isomerase
MPHLRIEYSANLKSRCDVAALCATLHGAIFASGLFEIGAIRVRAYCAEDYTVADLLPENGFIDLHFRVAGGRSAEALKRAGDAIFAAAEQQLAVLFLTPYFALSFSIDEINSQLSWKNNAMHTRLR